MSYIKEFGEGIQTFSFELHGVSGTGLNTTLTNGSFFRVRPVTTNSGSYSGYPSAFPLQTPYECKLTSINLTFRRANFDWNAVAGNILFNIETRRHFYNGSNVLNVVTVAFGNFSGSQTGTGTFTFNLTEDDFTYASGVPEIAAGELIGCRFVKTAAGIRRINSFVDIVMKLNYEEA